jgi:hypothetical protein
VHSLLFAAPGAWAQSALTGTIAGVAKDATGGVLPGTGVEVASPALIEEVRTAVTDDQGQYNGAYPLPWWMVQLASTFQNIPGPVPSASYVATNAQIAPTLGRNLGQCTGSARCNGTVTIANPFEPKDVELHRHMNAAYLERSIETQVQLRQSSAEKGVTMP